MEIYYSDRGIAWISSRIFLVQNLLSRSMDKRVHDKFIYTYAYFYDNEIETIELIKKVGQNEFMRVASDSSFTTEMVFSKINAEGRKAIELLEKGSAENIEKVILLEMDNGSIIIRDNNYTQQYKNIIYEEEINNSYASDFDFTKAEGMIYCSEDGKYHDAEDAWMYDGSRY